MAEETKNEVLETLCLNHKRAADIQPKNDRNPKKSRSGLRLLAGAHYLPKEDEDTPLGQDAHFISENKQTIGIADGVGGCIGSGIDSGVFARELMDNASEFLRSHRKKKVDPMTVLEAAYESSEALGASTALIITLDKDSNSLHAVSLGDSRFIIIRKGKTMYKSPVQVLRFNCPYQLGANSGFYPSDGEEIEVDVEAGDVLIAGSDGLFDNLFDEQIEEIVQNSMQDGKMPELELVAASLVQEAITKSLDEDCETPFGVEALKDGRTFYGGKNDDITVIVGSFLNDSERL